MFHACIGQGRGQKALHPLDKFTGNLDNIVVNQLYREGASRKKHQVSVIEKYAIHTKPRHTLLHGQTLNATAKRTSSNILVQTVPILYAKM